MFLVGKGNQRVSGREYPKIYKNSKRNRVRTEPHLYKHVQQGHHDPHCCPSQVCILCWTDLPQFLAHEAQACRHHPLKEQTDVVDTTLAQRDRESLCEKGVSVWRFVDVDVARSRAQ